MQVARRHCWAEPDRPQPLMPCSDPLWLVEAPLALAQLTGIDVNVIPESEVSVFVVPLAEDDWPERGLRRWVGTRADAMWHPLLWLPARLAAPMVAAGPAGAVTEEPLERWQARVAFEITNSGLYTADGWVDVYALLGLSLENPADVARVDAWLDGRADELLDAFSLEPFFAADQHDADPNPAPGAHPNGPQLTGSGPTSPGPNSSDPSGSGRHDLDRAVSDWSAALAADVTPLLVSSARALMADSLLSLAYDLTGPGVTLDDEAYARGAWWLASLAIEAVSDAGTGDAWLTVLEAVQAAGTDRAAVGLALQPALGLLSTSRDAYWPALADLQQFAADLGPVEAIPTTAPADQAAVPTISSEPITREPVPGTDTVSSPDAAVSARWSASAGQPSALSPVTPTPDVPPSAPAVNDRRRRLSAADAREQHATPGTNPQGRRRSTARW